MKKILFLCTGNSARSQMGEALLTKYAGHTFRVHSAGTEPKERIFPPVVEAMREIGIDLSDKKPKGIAPLLGRIYFEKVIIVCGDAETKCPAIFGPAERLFWPFEDPAAATGSPEEVLAVCRKVRDLMAAHIREWIEEQGIPVASD